MADPCPLVEISGTPRERGRQYGEQAAARIIRGAETYGAQLARDSLSGEALAETVARFVPRIAAFDPTYVDEMRGIAEGAGVRFEDIVLLNARTEILKLARRRAAGAPAPVGDDACTGVVVLPGAAAAGRLIHAQNWDWRAECAETSVVLRIRRADGPDILTFTEAGGLARSGLNAAGIAITANYLESDRDYVRLGVPLALIRRKILETPHFALALRAAYATPKSASNNLIVSQAGGIAIDLECAPDETFQVLPEHGLLAHANHWRSPVALAKLRDTGIANTPDSLYRDIRVDALLRPMLGRIDRAAVAAALADDWQSPWAVCRPPHPNVSGIVTATVATIVMDPALGEMDVAILPALGGDFVRYTLAPGDTAPRALHPTTPTTSQGSPR
jgi:isopenicillin-N N-acyltransferase-like protein